MPYTEARELCLRLFLQTLDSLRVAPRLRSRMSVRDGVLRIGAQSFPLSRIQTIRMVAFGKAAAEMAETVAEILAGAGTNLRGVVVGPSPALGQPLPAGPRHAPSRRAGTGAGGMFHRGSDFTNGEFQYFRAGHPYPDEQSFQAADAVLELLKNCTARDLILFLISGGGSALLEKPFDSSISLDDMRRLHQVLVTCGAGIQEINTLRKHFSAVKGGRLAQRASPAAQVTLYVSDVPDHLPSAVASGPTMPDESTVEDCRRIAAQYGLLEKLPGSIRARLESGQLPETPKPGDACFAQSRYDCLLSNRDGIEKLLELARARGIRAEADTRCDDWQFERAANYLLRRVETLRQQSPGKPVLLVSGGELSSPVAPGAKGLGGRNQAFVLYCVPKIAGQPMIMFSAGTDGIDGNSPAAGAIADGQSAERAAAIDMIPEEFLSRNDSYSFFERLNDAIMTGPTGTNVRDLRLLLAV